MALVSYDRGAIPRLGLGRRIDGRQSTRGKGVKYITTINLSFRASGDGAGGKTPPERQERQKAIRISGREPTEGRIHVLRIQKGLESGEGGRIIEGKEKRRKVPQSGPECWTSGRATKLRRAQVKRRRRTWKKNRRGRNAAMLGRSRRRGERNRQRDAGKGKGPKPSNVPGWVSRVRGEKKENS